MIDLPSIARNLVQIPDGTWRSKSATSVSYPEWGNQACYQVEDLSFWFRHRNHCILEVMKQYPPPGPIFDVGGGNGFVAKAMQDAGLEVVLVEPGATGARNARLRGVQHVVCAGVEDAGFPPAALAAVGLFDVVEHIAEEHAFLSLVKRYLSPSGRVYLTVPAYPALWSHEDLDAGHFRRYSRQALRKLLTDSGFTVEFLTGFFQFLPPAILAARALPYRMGLTKTGSHDVHGKMRAQHEVRSALVRGILCRLQQRELDRIRARRAMSFGGSWLIVGRSGHPAVAR
jgi:SAM-dependent methyltransferase